MKKVEKKEGKEIKYKSNENERNERGRGCGAGDEYRIK